jgi:hypothetical protein
MTNQDEERLFSTILYFILLSFIFLGGYISGQGNKQREMEKQIVEKGYAFHNPTNGVWQWK